MSRLFEIKLSGIEGLMPRFFGDVDRTGPSPNLRIANEDNSKATSGDNRTMADGVYNPFRMYGYLSAANAQITTVTFAASSTSTNLVSSVLFDKENSEFYVAERGNNLWLGTTLDATGLTTQGVALGNNNIITDLEIYQVNGVRKIFYSFYAISDTFTANAGTDVLTFANNTQIANGTPVTFTNSGGGLPSPLVAGTTYFAVSVTGFTFKVSATLNGSAIDITTTGTGTNTVHGNFGGIGISNLPFDTQHDKWLNQTVAGAFNMGANFHVMIPSDNSYMYVLDGNAVHKIDGTIASGGTNGTATPNVLYFPPYFNLVDAVDYRGNLLIAMHQYSSAIRGVSSLTSTYNAKCAVYIWDKLSSSAGAKDYIPLPGIKEIRRIFTSTSGVVRLIGINNENISVLQEYDGSKFNTIFELGYNAYPEYVDSFTQGPSYEMWQANDGNIYAYGRVSPNDNEGLFKLQNVTSTGAGAILYCGGNAGTPVNGYKAFRTGLYIAFTGGGTTYELLKWDMYGTGASGVTPVANPGNVYTPVYYMTEVQGYTHYPTSLATLNYIDIWMTPCASVSPSDLVVTINVFINQSTSHLASYPIYADKASRGYYRMEVNAPYVNSVQLQVVFPTDKIGTTADIGIASAVLTYTPTNMKG